MARGNYVRHVDSVLFDIMDVEAQIREEGRLPDLVARLHQLMREHQLAVDAMIMAEEASALIKLSAEELRRIRVVGNA